MSKTYDLAQLSTSTTYQLALMLGDTSTVSGKYLFEDEELALFIAEAGGDIKLAAARACRSVAMRAAKGALSVTVFGASWDKKSISDRYLRMAQEFERSAADETFSTRAQWTDGDIDFVRSMTNETQFDNEDAEQE